MPKHPIITDLLLNGGLSLVLKLLKCGYMMKNLAG